MSSAFNQKFTDDDWLFYIIMVFIEFLITWSAFTVGFTCGAFIEDMSTRPASYSIPMESNKTTANKDSYRGPDHPIHSPSLDELQLQPSDHHPTRSTHQHHPLTLTGILQNEQFHSTKSTDHPTSNKSKMLPVPSVSSMQSLSHTPSRRNHETSLPFNGVSPDRLRRHQTWSRINLWLEDSDLLGKAYDESIQSSRAGEEDRSFVFPTDGIKDIELESYLQTKSIDENHFEFSHHGLSLPSSRADQDEIPFPHDRWMHSLPDSSLHETNSIHSFRDNPSNKDIVRPPTLSKSPTQPSFITTSFMAKHEYLLWMSAFWTVCITLCLLLIMESFTGSNGPTSRDPSITTLRSLCFSPLGAWTRWSLTRSHRLKTLSPDLHLPTLTANLVSVLIVSLLVTFDKEGLWTQPVTSGLFGCCSTISTFFAELHSLWHERSSWHSVRYAFITFVSSGFIVQIVRLSHS